MGDTCNTVTTERLSAFVDGDLPAAEAAALRAHAATCTANLFGTRRGCKRFGGELWLRAGDKS